VITEPYPPSKANRLYQLATVDQGRSRVIPFIDVRCDSYLDVCHSQETGKILVCGRENTAQVYRLIEDSWTPVTPPLQGAEFRSAVDGEHIVLVSENAVYRIYGPSTTPLVPMPRGIPEFPLAPSAMLLTGNTLYVAFGRGEFGGGLYRFDLDQSPLTPTKILAGSVRFLARSGSGKVWAASGLAHMGDLSGAVYRVEGATAEVVAKISGYQAIDDSSLHILEKSGVSFPGLTSVAGLAFSGDERPIVVFPELGVFRLTPGGFAPVYQGTLNFDYETRFGDMEVIVGSSPVGVVMSSAGDTYVASRSLGVFRFRADSQPGLEQLTFAER
jgi:hypothetical protein